MTHPGCPSRPPHGLPHHPPSRGFTLVELLIAVAIAALLLGVAAPAYTAYVDRSRTQRAVADLHDLELRLNAWRARTGAFPSQLAEVGGPAADPWGTPYRYLDIAAHARGEVADKDASPRKDKNLKPINTDYDLYSTGPDRDTDVSLTSRKGQDDVIRAANGRFFGVAEKF